MIPHFHQSTVIILISCQLVYTQTSQCHPLHIIIKVIPEIITSITASPVPFIESRQERFHDIFIQISLILGIIRMAHISVCHYIQCVSLRPSATTARTHRLSGFRCIRFLPIDLSRKSIPPTGILKEILDISFRTLIGGLCPINIRHIFTGGAPFVDIRQISVITRSEHYKRTTKQ